jgi:hypothetical protein
MDYFLHYAIYVWLSWGLKAMTKPINCIAILQTKKGFRITYIEDINTLYWKKISDIQDEKRELLTNTELDEYFQNSIIYSNKDEAWHNAMLTFREYKNTGINFASEQIHVISGYEKRDY